MVDPDLLLLDEPTAGLDLGGREALVARLADLAADPTARPPCSSPTTPRRSRPASPTPSSSGPGRVLAAGPLDDTVTAAALSACFDTTVTLERRDGRFIALADAEAPVRRTRGFGGAPRVTYPPAPRQDIVEDIHGHAVADPYRWLEDPDDPATRAWSKAQDELVRPYLDRQPGRDGFATRLRELSVGLVSSPTVRGDRFFVMRRHPHQEHAVLVVLSPGDDPLTGGRVLIDPSALSDDDTITLDGWLPSPDGTLLAYLLSDAGTEESTLSGHGRRHAARPVDGPDRPLPLQLAGLDSRRPGALLRPPPPARRGAGRRGGLPPPGPLPPARRRPRERRAGLRRRARPHRLLLASTSRATAAGC